MNRLFAPRSARTTLRGILLVVIVALVVFGPQVLVDVSRGDDDPPAAKDAITVRTVRVKARSVSDGRARVRATGTLEPRRQVQLAFAVQGVVDAWRADEGDAVDEGEVIARLDEIPFESAVSQARARVHFLEKSVARSGRLLEQDALSSEEFDAQEAELTGARAQLRLVEWQLERSALRAPFDARVRRRMVEVGQVVAAGTVAFDLISARGLEVHAAVAAADLAYVDLEAPVRVRIADNPRWVTSGHVDHSPVASDERSGSVPILVRLDDSNGKLLPGMVADLEFGSSSTQGSGSEIRVPVQALRLDDAGQSVWRVKNGRAERVSVEIGLIEGDLVVLNAGVEEGDRLVLHAPDRLRHGDPVQVIAEVQR
jgi:membrane fusion protein (multidrug efflux system)